MEVSVIFNADTGQYEAKLAGLDAKTAKSAQAVADAKNKILAYHQEQIQSAVKLGKSAEDLERIQSKSAATMANVTESNANKMIASLDRLIARHKAMRAEMDTSLKLPPVPASSAGHGFTDRMATSAVVRTLDGNPGIRAEENFLTQFPAFTKAAQGMAVAIGGIGLVWSAVDLGKKVYDFDQKMEHARQTVSDAFAEMEQQTRKEGVDLDLTGDKLDIAIAKLEHKPSNELKLALDEDRKAASDLADEAIRAQKELAGIFKESGVSHIQEFGSFWLAQAKKLANFMMLPGGEKMFSDRDTRPVMSTEEDEKLVKDAHRNITKASDDMQDALDAADPKDRQRIRNEQRFKVNGANQNAIAAIQSKLDEVNRLAQAHPDADYSARQELLEDSLHQLKGERHNTQASFANADKQTKETSLQTQKDAADKAAEQQMKSIEETDAKLKAKFATDHASMLGAQVAFWQAMADSSKILPANRARVLDEYASAEQAYMRGLDEAARQGVAEQKRQTEQQQKDQHDSWDKDFQDWTAAGQRSAQAVAEFWSLRMLEADRGSQNELDALKKSNDAYREVLREREQLDQANKRLALGMSRNDATVERAQLQIAVSTGRVSPREAALENQRIDRKESDAQVGELQQEYDRHVAQDQKIGQDSNQPDYVSAETINALAALNKAKADQMAQDQVDAARVAATGWKDSLTDAIDQWSQHAKDTAAQVAQLFDQTISETNNNLADLMSGEYKKGDFKKEGQALAKTVSVDALQHAEAPLLSGLGKLFGAGGKAKPTGTPNDPISVSVVDGTGQSLSGSGGLSSLFRGIFKSGTKDGGDDGGLSALGGLFGSSGTSSAASGIGDSVAGGAADVIGGIGDFLGGFALGGDVPESGIYDVGEMGREKVFLPAGSHVTPNHEMGSGDTHIHIDARDSSDPAQTEARLHRAIQSYIPGIVGASLAAQREQRMRQPSTKR